MQIEHETLTAEECALAVKGLPIPREKPASAAAGGGIKQQPAQAQRAKTKTGKKRVQNASPALAVATSQEN